MRRNIFAALSTALLGAALFVAPTVAPSALAQDASFDDAPSALAQDAATNSGAYARIQPYVDAETFAVVRVAPAQLDLDALDAKLTEVFTEAAKIRGYDDEALADCLAEFKATLAGAKKFAREPLAIVRQEFGLSEIFFVYPRLDAQGFFAYVPLDAAKRDRLAELLEDETPFEPFEVDGGLIVGTPNFDADYFENFEASPNPKLEAFLNGSDATLQAYVAEFQFRELFNTFAEAAGNDLLAERLDEALDEAPETSREAFETFEENFRGATFELDVNRLRLALRLNFASEDAAQTLLKLQGVNSDAGLDALVKLFREEADEDVQELADAYRLVPLVRELIRGFSTSAAPRLDGASLTSEFELGPSIRLTNPIVLPTAVGLLLPAVNAARTAARRMQSVNNIKQLGLATHNFHDVNNGLPARYTVDEDGEPLHSWRVLLLPYLEHAALYEQIRLDEPWDSEWNSQFHDQMPIVYARPGGDPSEGCFYSCVADKRAAFQPATSANQLKGAHFASVTDGTSNTLLFVERNEPVCWMDPTADLTLEEFLENAADPQYFAGGSNVGMCDGSVRFVSETVDPDVLKAMVTRDGGETGVY